MPGGTKPVRCTRPETTVCTVFVISARMRFSTRSVRGLTNADTVLKAGGFDFLALLYLDHRLFELRDNRLPTSVP